MAFAGAGVVGRRRPRGRARGHRAPGATTRGRAARPAPATGHPRAHRDAPERSTAAAGSISSWISGSSPRSGRGSHAVSSWGAARAGDGGAGTSRTSAGVRLRRRRRRPGGARPSAASRVRAAAATPPHRAAPPAPATAPRRNARWTGACGVGRHAGARTGRGVDRDRESCASVERRARDGTPGKETGSDDASRAAEARQRTAATPHGSADRTVLGPQRPEHGRRRRRGGRGDLVHGSPKRRGERGADGSDERRLVLATPVRHRGEVRRIGLDEQAVERAQRPRRPGRRRRSGTTRSR